jgi:RNA polymerase-binding protein DksA
MNKTAKKKHVKKPVRKPARRLARKLAMKLARRSSNKVARNPKHKPVKKAVQKPAKKPALKFTKRELDRFKAKLLTEKNKVLEEMGELQENNLKQSISDASGENSRYTYHLGDVASLSYGREFSMGLAERQQKYLEEIDEALERIAEGTYGICKVTGEQISVERLEEVPVAKYSVKGKEMLERRRRQGG